MIGHQAADGEHEYKLLVLSWMTAVDDERERTRSDLPLVLVAMGYGWQKGGWQK